MTNETLQQRIKYLVEHGGLYEDPLQEIRRRVDAALILAGASAAFTLIDILIALR